jgi:6-phosphogluconolactonase
MTQWFEFADADAVAGAGADFIASKAREAIARQGQFRLVLAGGTTPLACYRLLAAGTHEWDKWQLYYGDERCLPEDHAERNHRMVMATGLSDRVGEHHVIAAEQGPQQAAQDYQQIVENALPFDLVLLGMGEDGHTASLFPGHDLQPGERVLCTAVYQSPKPPSERVSLTLNALQDCHDMLLLVTGEGKRAALTQWHQGAQLPIARVTAIPQAQVFVEKSLCSG